MIKAFKKKWNHLVNPDPDFVASCEVCGFTVKVYKYEDGYVLAGPAGRFRGPSSVRCVCPNGMFVDVDASINISDPDGDGYHKCCIVVGARHGEDVSLSISEDSSLTKGFTMKCIHIGKDIMGDK